MGGAPIEEKKPKKQSNKSNKVLPGVGGGEGAGGGMAGKGMAEGGLMDG